MVLVIVVYVTQLAPQLTAVTLPPHSTHSVLKISLTIVVWISNTFENNFEIKHKLEKYLKENCVLSSYQHCSFKYFLKIHFIWEISQK